MPILYKQKMQSNFKVMVENILQTNDQHSYQEMRSMLLKFDNVETILRFFSPDENFLFVFCEILSKNIQNEEFNSSNTGELSEEERKNQQSLSYRFILGKVTEIYFRCNNQSMVGRSIKNLLVTCLKGLLVNREEKQFFLGYLKIFFPSFGYDQKINYHHPLFTCLPLEEIEPEKNIVGFEILTNLLEYVTELIYNKKYYTYRYNVYFFRNIYFPIYLNLAISAGKNYLANSLYFNKPYLKFLHSIIVYPFSISTEDAMEESLEIEETYFPLFFRSLLCDFNFIKLIFNCYLLLVERTNNFDDEKQNLRNYVEILGKIFTSNSYIFYGESERKEARQLYSQIGYIILDNFKFYDSLYLNYIISFEKRILGIYRDQYYSQKTKLQYKMKILQFIEKVVLNAKIIIDEGKNNPISQAFSLLNSKIMNSYIKEQNVEIQNHTDLILMNFVLRISNFAQMNEVWNKYEWHSEDQYEKFEEFYQPIVNVANGRIKTFYKFFEEIQPQELHECCLIFWMYLAAFMLPKRQANLQQTKVILKFFNAKKIQSVASISYMIIVINQLMGSFAGNEPNTNLWMGFKTIYNISFSQFLSQLIQGSFCIIEKTNNAEILSSVVFLFKSIFVKLKMNSNEDSQHFTNYLKQCFLSIDNTSLGNPKFYKNRIQFLSIISITWVNSGKYNILYSIYQLIANKMKNQPNLIIFAQYLNDLTGILNQIRRLKPFEIFFQLALPDLKNYFASYIDHNSFVFKDQYFLKSYTKFVYSLTCCWFKNYPIRNTHSSLPTLIYELLITSIEKLLLFDYDGIILEIWENFIKLNPLSQPLALHRDMPLKNEKQYNSLLILYSENFAKYKDAQSLYQIYPFIKQKLDILREWWFEVMERDLHPEISIQQLINERIWIYDYEIRKLGKLIYKLSKYDEKYWKRENISEQNFCQKLITSYKATI